MTAWNNTTGSNITAQLSKPKSLDEQDPTTRFKSERWAQASLDLLGQLSQPGVMVFSAADDERLLWQSQVERQEGSRNWRCEKEHPETIANAPHSEILAMSRSIKSYNLISKQYAALCCISIIEQRDRPAIQSFYHIFPAIFHFSLAPEVVLSTKKMNIRASPWNHLRRKAANRSTGTLFV